LNTGGTLTPEVKDDIRLELEILGVIDKHKHDPIQKDIQILEALENQGITLGHSAGLMTSQASNDTVSVGIVAGPKTGSIGHAFVKLLTRAKIGHEGLTVILEPNLPVKPSSLMFPTRKITSMRQASLFYGPVQSGAAKAVTSYIETGKIPKKSLTEDIAIMALDIDLDSRDRREIVTATQQAVESALAGIWR
ncbi:MAG: formaldehyde-activating enzyme, partial [Candidatus Thorarchaeota archaeon]|nr:formaldehyde-activating enzyme [Candidatus Thorarchaeota archaeon]